MAPTFWFTVQIGKRRIPIPLLLLLPFAPVLDALALVGLSVYGIWKHVPQLVKIGSVFFLSRMTLMLMLYGGRFKIDVRDKRDHVRIYGGWTY